MHSPHSASAQTIIVAAKLHKNQLERHLELFECLPEVRRVLVVRHEPLPERLSKLENYNFESGSMPANAWRMWRSVRELARKESADWVIGFNPVPWGSLGSLAAAGLPTRVCLSLIGRDYQQVQRPLGAPFRAMLRAADAVTVTGERMRQGLLRLGVPAGHIRVLPHSVDLSRFYPTEGEKRWDVVSVGQLIERKNMHVLIDAVARLAQQGLRLRVAILGTGPLESSLRRRAAERGVAAQIEFLGYRDNVEATLREARAFCLASSWEGVPFALMEAMATGLVPIVTDVGTISDWVRHEENGLLVPVGDVAALADALRRVCAQPACFASLHQTLLRERQKLGFAHGAAVWRAILQSGRGAPPATTEST